MSKNDRSKELQELRSRIAKELGKPDLASGSYVTFSRKHMQLDVQKFLDSEDGASSIEKVIKLSRNVPTRKLAAG